MRDDAERVAGQWALAETVVPYDSDEVTRLILDRHDADAYRPVAHLTVGRSLPVDVESSPLRALTGEVA